MASRSDNWFEVDRAGLAKLVERRGKTFVLAELLQNAFDAPGTTRVIVTAAHVPNRPLVDLCVTDDAPNGFSRLDHAFTLFADSAKKGDPTLRGRFNLGEKLVLSLCEEAEIRTVRGTVTFNHLGRHVTRKGARASGSQVSLRLRMTRAELDEALQSAFRFIPPVETWINERKIPARAPIAEVAATLLTEWADPEGVLRRGPRKTVVRIYEPMPGAPPALYELGIPVAETAIPFDLDVQQKVPVSMERDSVPSAYLRALKAAVLNAVAGRLDPTAASESWVSDALSHRDVAPEAVVATVRARFGDKAVVQDPSDPEANGTAVAHGYTVIPGGAFSREAWERIRSSEAAAPAGAVFPTNRVNGGGAPPAAVRVTEAMATFRALAAGVAERLVGASVRVDFCSDFGASYAACYGDRRIIFNVARLGRRWFEGALNPAQIDLLIHELGHEYEANHTSHRYHDALTRLAGEAVDLALREPQLFRMTHGKETLR